MENIASAAVAASFAAFGQEAVYAAPVTDIETGIIVISRRPDEISDVLGSAIQSRSAVFEIRVSELPGPQKGGKIVFGGTVYVIQNTPQYKDDLRLVWILNTYPDS